MSVILMTTLFYKAIILQGEIWLEGLTLRVWNEVLTLVLNVNTISNRMFSLARSANNKRISILES